MPAPPFFARTSPPLAIEIVRTRLSRLRREINQRLSSSCRGLPDLHTTALDAVRARSAALVRRQRSLALDILHFVDHIPSSSATSLRHSDAQPLPSRPCRSTRSRRRRCSPPGRHRLPCCRARAARAQPRLARGPWRRPVREKVTVSAPPLRSARRERRWSLTSAFMSAPLSRGCHHRAQGTYMGPAAAEVDFEGRANIALGGFWLLGPVARLRS